MEMRSPSLRFRLLAAAAVWVMIGFVAAFFALSAIFRDHVTEQFFDELYVHVDELERLTTESEHGEVQLRSVFSDPRYEIPASGFYWEVRDNEATVLKSVSLGALNMGQVEHPRPLIERPRLISQGPTGPLLLTEIEQPIPGVGVRSYLVGTDESHLETLIADFNQTLIGALAVLGLAMIAAAAAIAAFGLAPLRKLTVSLKDVRSGKTRTLEGHHPQEVAPLVRELNALIGSGRKSVETARAQAGTLAHALKTPLAIVTSEAYELDARGEDKSASAIIDQCRTMQRHIDHHIARARASAVSRLPGVRCQVDEIAGEVTGALGRLHARSGIELSSNVHTGLALPMDAQDLREVLGNLVDNAFKHARTHIELNAGETKDGGIYIRVEDDGPGVAPEDRDRILEPGARLDRNAPGSGLGLAIVRDLVSLYGGQLELSASELGGLSIAAIFESATER